MKSAQKIKNVKKLFFIKII